MNQKLLKNGYLALPKLDKAKCDRILEHLDTLTFEQWNGKHKIKGFGFDQALTNLYEIKIHSEVMAIPEVYEVAHDPKILKIVKAYLGAEPIQTQACAWWSVHRKSPEAGQQFHQDFTYKKFIKLMLYLVDVTMENGPHVYVVGSLRNMIKPEPYRVSQRVSDEFIKKNYSDIKYLTGKKGTMNLVDTRGWHKGNPVKSGHRVLIQLEWTDDAIDITTGKQYIQI